jgi:hypothetical protein
LISIVRHKRCISDLISSQKAFSSIWESMIL